MIVTHNQKYYSEIIFWDTVQYIIYLYIFIVQIYFCFTHLAFRRQVRFHFFAGVL